MKVWNKAHTHYVVLEGVTRKQYLKNPEKYQERKKVLTRLPLHYPADAWEEDSPSWHNGIKLLEGG